ncbi:hypothetical protein B0H14DRAFT_528937 [Mycena olivaceomarginata]|nr:hypothetical protein B0H14DRAFT_528937 [Mycena olivaceomarginata]
MGCVVEYAAAQEKEKRGEICKRPSETKRRRGNEGGYCFVVECGCGFRWWVCGGEEDGSNAMRCEGRCERESWFSCVHERRKWRRGSVASATATHSSPTPHLALPINPLLPKPKPEWAGLPVPARARARTTSQRSCWRAGCRARECVAMSGAAGVPAMGSRWDCVRGERRCNGRSCDARGATDVRAEGGRGCRRSRCATGLRGRDGRAWRGVRRECMRKEYACATGVRATGGCEGGCVQRPWVRKEPVGVTGLRGRNGRARGVRRACMHKDYECATGSRGCNGRGCARGASVMYELCKIDNINQGSALSCSKRMAWSLGAVTARVLPPYRHGRTTSSVHEGQPPSWHAATGRMLPQRAPHVGMHTVQSARSGDAFLTFLTASCGAEALAPATARRPHGQVRSRASGGTARTPDAGWHGWAQQCTPHAKRRSQLSAHTKRPIHDSTKKTGRPRPRRSRPPSRACRTSSARSRARDTGRTRRRGRARGACTHGRRRGCGRSRRRRLCLESKTGVAR